MQGQREFVSLVVVAGTGGIHGWGLVCLLLGGGLQSVLSKIASARDESVVERGGEAGDVCGDVGENLWRRLVVVTDLEKETKDKTCLILY